MPRFLFLASLSLLLMPAAGYGSDILNGLKNLWSPKPPSYEIARQCADTIESYANELAFESEIAAVEQAWDEPIPDYLILIGGVDWPAWAFICKKTGDPIGIFRGEYRDALRLYQGKFRYVHPKGKPMPQRIFDSYFMGYLDSHMGREGIFFQELAEPPVDYFYMEIVEPDLIRRWNP